MAVLHLKVVERTDSYFNYKGISFAFCTFLILRFHLSNRMETTAGLASLQMSLEITHTVIVTIGKIFLVVQSGRADAVVF